MKKIKSFRPYEGTIKRLALVGFRATGKTTIAKKLADLLGWFFVDIDELFVESVGMSISDWVLLNGWEAFRRSESELLRSISRRSRIVVATGGGIIEMENNRRLLREKFFVVWLDAGVETIVNRIRSDKNSLANRPSLLGKDPLSEIPEVMKRRETLYRSVSHIGVATDDEKPHKLAELIYRSIKEYI